MTSIFQKSNSSSKLIKNGIASNQKVLGVKLQNHSGFLGKEVQSNRRYGTELSDYAKMAGVKGIIHSDESMDKYSINEQEIASVRKALGMSENDAFVLVVAPENTAKKALENVCVRAEMDFIPKETRRANPDGSTSFMRPLPGRARLYPETDIPVIEITKEMLKKIEKNKGDSLETKKERLFRILNMEMAERILRSKNLSLFERIVADLEVDPTLVATTLENTLVSLRRDGVELANLENTVFDLFQKYKEGLFVKAAIPEILKLVAKGNGMRIEDAVKQGKLGKISGKELERIARENNFDIKEIMKKYRLNIEPEEIGNIKNSSK